MLGLCHLHCSMILCYQGVVGCIVLVDSFCFALWADLVFENNHVAMMIVENLSCVSKQYLSAKGRGSNHYNCVHGDGNIGFAKNLYSFSQQIQAAQHHGFAGKWGVLGVLCGTVWLLLLDLSVQIVCVCCVFWWGGVCRYWLANNLQATLDSHIALHSISRTVACLQWLAPRL